MLPKNVRFFSCFQNENAKFILLSLQYAECNELKENELIDCGVCSKLEYKRLKSMKFKSFCTERKIKCKNNFQYYADSVLKFGSFDNYELLYFFLKDCLDRSLFRHLLFQVHFW